jgi:hypothetical protein
MRGKYYSYEPKYIKDFPIKDKKISGVVKIVNQILELNEDKTKNIMSDKLIKYKELLDKLNKEVFSLYQLNDEEQYFVKNSLRRVRNIKND